jgi:O-antigen/teichoic acid export membrane protein
MAATDPDRSLGREAQVTGELTPHLGRWVPSDPVADADGRVVLDTLPMPAVTSPARGKLAEVARGSTLNLAGAAFSGAAAVALTVVVTRSFSKPLAGAFFTAISLFLIAETAATLGGYVGLVNFIAGLRSLGQESRVSAILRAAIVPVAVISVAMAAAIVLAAGPLTRAVILGGQLGHTGADQAAAIAALRWLAVALPFAALLDTLLGATRGYRDMQPTVALDRLGRSGLQLLGMLVAAVMGAASLLAPLWALPYLPAAVLAWLWLRRIRPRRGLHRVGAPAARGDRRRPAGAAVTRRPVPAAWSGFASKQLARTDARGFWRFTAPRAVAALAQITIQRLDIVLVAIMRGPAEAAIYTAATRFLVAGQFINAAISMAAQPRFAELFTVGKRREVNSVYQATTAWLMLLTWPLYLLAIIFGPEVLTVFGHSYRAGASVMVILAGAMLLATACGQVDMVLIASGRSSWSLMNGLLAVAANVGLDLVLIPRYGIAGAAIGWAVAIALTNVVPLVQLAAVSRVHPFGRSTLAAVLLPVVCMAAVPLAVRAVAGPGAVAAVAGIVMGSALLAAGSWRFRDTLHLSELPGIAALARRFSKPDGHTPKNSSAPRDQRGGLQ